MNPLRYGIALFFSLTIVTFAIFSFIFLLFAKKIGVNAEVIWPLLLSSALSAAAGTAIIVGTVPIVNHILTTLRRLARLDSLNHPLLVRLQREAPGTFNRAQTIAGFAPQVARAVGADPTLVRIGTYFHDIGKLKNPALFAENNQGSEPRASGMSAEEKMAIFASHLTEGIALASEHRLPQEVVDLIAEHHGTTLVRSLFDTAKKQETRPKETTFRYPGPKPRSMEAVIIMLSDGIEEGLRKTNAQNETEIARVVEAVMQERFDEGQFSLLSIRGGTLQKLRDAYVDTIRAIYRNRSV